MSNETNFLGAIPVLPTSNLERDVKWYKEQLGFHVNFQNEGYGGVSRGGVYLHFQEHSGTEDDPMLDGSVLKIFVKDISLIYNDLLEKGTITDSQLHKNTPWKTHEVGLFDLNKNAIFFVEVVKD